MTLQVKNELIALKGERELLQADEVWKWAREHKSSALHSQFEWNEKRAAVEHWRSTARRLIAIHVTYETGVRQFVSLTIDRSKDGGGYRDLDEVVKAPDLLEILKDDALRELERFKAKYERIIALKPVIDAIDQVTENESRRGRRRRRGGDDARAA